MFAIKVSRDPLIILKKRNNQELLKEIQIMKEYQHPFIVRIIEDFTDDKGHLCAV